MPSPFYTMERKTTQTFFGIFQMPEEIRSPDIFCVVYQAAVYLRIQNGVAMMRSQNKRKNEN